MENTPFVYERYRGSGRPTGRTSNDLDLAYSVGAAGNGRTGGIVLITPPAGRHRRPAKETTVKGLRNTDQAFVSIPADGVLCEKVINHGDGATEWLETFQFPDGRRIQLCSTGAYYCAGNNGEWRQAHSYAIDITIDNGWQNQPIVPDFVLPTEFYYVDRLPSRSAS